MNHYELHKFLDFILSMDIAHNADPRAIFDPLMAGFNLWATPQFHPDDPLWIEVLPFMDRGAWTKPCAYVGTVYYMHQSKVLEFSTDAYLLQDRRLLRGWKAIHNRTVDVTWTRSITHQVFERLGLDCPEMILTD